MDNPIISFIYPWCNHDEEFLLLKPKHALYYDPIKDLFKHMSVVSNALHLDKTSPEDANQSFILQQTMECALKERDWVSVLMMMMQFNCLLEKAGQCPTDLSVELNLDFVKQNYRRLIVTRLQELKKYKSGTDLVYGEITPGLVNKFIQKANLTLSSVFIDLGSSMGQVVCQVSLTAKSLCFSMELDKAHATLTSKMVEQFKIRCSKWGGEVGIMEVEQGDMLKSPRLASILAQVNAILVTNTKFDGSRA
ncbi:histone methylation protein DOT1-domain-containing protein [Armillaria mellea]|nr:histone methylation protein DOT1-domain-containing protein [Armillaria mellea]